MELTVRPELLDLSCQVKFKESLLGLTKEDERLPLINYFLKAFELRLNDLKFDLQRLSDNWIHFSKFYGATWFDVSFGLEEVNALIRNPENEAMVKDLWGKLTEALEQADIDFQRMTIQQHFSTKGDANSFLRFLNPNCPNEFKDFLDGSGVFYTLKISAHSLTTYITLVNSLHVPGGLYFSVENVFSPNLYDFQNTFRIAKEYYDFVLSRLNITLEEAPV
jgi:hypothetical protein